MSLGVRPTKRALNELYSVLDFTDHIRLSQPELGYTTTASTSPDNIDANRYRDILAYDHALLPGPYLNAASIPPFHPTSLSFIASQAPLPDTYTAFYTHIVQQQVRVLVNLTPLIEKGRLKAHQYWPDASSPPSASEAGTGGVVEQNEMVLQNGWKVTSDSESKIDLEEGKATLNRRVIHIDTSSTPSSTTRGGGWSVTQFHLTSWPDHGVFPTTLLLQLIKETQMVAMPKIYPPPPIWIHCSAGVGRSGTLAAAYIAQVAINIAKRNGDAEALAQDANMSIIGRNARAEVWDLPVRIVEHLRRYRPRMVQTIEQFEAVYQLVAEMAEEAGLVEK